MSKGLEALKELKCAYVNLPLDDGLSVCTAITKEYKKELDIIEKELKALEIIKAIKPFIVYENVGGQYHLETIVDEIGLTKDNYDLLKEVLL